MDHHHSSQVSPSASSPDEINFRVPFLRHPLPMWVYDTRTLAFLEVNDAAVKHYGYSRDEFLAMSITEIRPAEDIPHLLETLAQPGLDAHSFGEWRHILKNGQLIYVEIFSHLIEYNGRNAAMVTARDTTERKRVEESIRLSEFRLRSLLDTIPYVVWVKDLEGKFISVNQSFIKTHSQKSIEDVIGKTDLDITDRTNAEKYMANDREVIETGEKLNIIEDVLENGQHKLFETHKSPIFDEHGVVIGSAGFARDITERKNTEDALRQSEARFRTLFEQAAVGVALMETATGRYLRVNKKFSDLLGYTVEEMHQINFMTITHPDTLQADLERMDRLKNGDVREFTSEKLYIRKDGCVIWVNLTVSAMWAPGTRPDFHIAIVQDITERKRIEDNLRLSEEKFRRVFYTSPDAISINQIADGRYIYINKSFTQIAGYAEEEVIGHTSFEINIWENPEERKNLVDGLKKHGIVENLEVRFRAKNGTVITGLLSASIIDIDGEPCIIIITRDISTHKATEQLLRDAQRRESIGVLSSGIAHDFNNLLGIMMGNVSLAQAHLSADHPSISSLHRALSAMERAAELTQQMLAYSGKGKFQISTINVSAVVQEHVSLYTISLSKNVKLVTHLPSSPVYIKGDPGQIEQIIMNLIINGGDAIGEKQGVVSVTLTAVAMAGKELAVYGRITNTALTEGSYALLEVSDNGMGMSADIMNKIFDPFFTTKFTGRGLGLSAVLGIIRSHEGGIVLESTVGKGTTFRILLPVCSAPDTCVTPPEVDNLPVLPVTTTVLVIDDEQEIATMAKEMLEAGKYQTLVSLNPVEGIEQYERLVNGIGIVLLDLTMPEMSGKEVVEALQKINPAVQIIISSGYTEDEVARRIGTLHVSGFIQKPYRLSSLLALVGSVLRQTAKE